MTVLAIIQRSTDFLAKKGVESPRLQIELLLAHVLKMARMKLYLNFERVLTEPELEQLRGLVRRRAEREPLQHILGTTSFCGLEIMVNGDVLIPRPETEILAERAWSFLSSAGHPAPVFLDFGTGSGCLALAVGMKCPSAEIYALDISGAALAIARENAAALGLAGRIQFHEGDGFASLPAGLRFHLVASNPPYIPSGEIEGLEPEVREHDPQLALDGGVDGLDFYRRLAAEAGPRLWPGGKLMAEFGDGQAEAVGKIFSHRGWVVEAVERDYSRRERFLIARFNAS